MLRVGLTGSIAVGKSFVAGVLAELGCRVLDADELARRVVEPGTEGLRAVVEAFGREVLSEDGALDRARLGRLVFADENSRKLLNSILHPLIKREQDEWLSRREQGDAAGVAVVDAALMIESGGYKRFDRLVVVHCRPEVQLERLMRRNRLSREEAERRVAAQMPQAEKLRYADFSVDTSEGFDETREQVVQLYGELRRLAAVEAGPEAAAVGDGPAVEESEDSGAAGAASAGARVASEAVNDGRAGIEGVGRTVNEVEGGDERADV
ncbi:MAG TPA: dephospho-CoA kinase [Pyrinomonadaceae bacterium]|nr:dephospho-CoA kinase [Pyrinomonadaceae bacterium]